MYSWTIFDNWQLNPTNSWSDFDILNRKYKNITLAKYDKLLPLISKWDKLTKSLGNDPTHINWNNFRPLRLSREEDWSDWLSFLINTSETGLFAKKLVNHKIKPRQIFREDNCEGYRADLVINWNNKDYTHIEVKIGDEDLLKTYATSLKLEKKYPKTTWTHFILLLSNQLSAWKEIEKENSPITINVLTWDDVAITLRKSLKSSEPITWKVWAYSFIGAIEQVLVGYKGFLLEKHPLEKVDEKIEILSKSLV